MPTKRSILAALAFIGATAAPALAHAEVLSCPNTVGGGAEVDEIDETTRSRWLRQTLATESTRADLWTWGWAGAGVAGTGTHLALGATGDYNARVDRFTAAAGTTMLTVTTLLDPLSVPRVDGDGTSCKDVQQAEKVLLTVATDEARRQGILGHALPIGGSIAGGLVLGLGYDRWTSGALNAAIGIVVSEIKMLTQPMGGARGLTRYRAGLLGPEGTKVGFAVTPVLIGKDGGGFALSLSY